MSPPSQAAASRSICRAVGAERADLAQERVREPRRQVHRRSVRLRRQRRRLVGELGSARGLPAVARYRRLQRVVGQRHPRPSLRQLRRRASRSSPSSVSVGRPANGRIGTARRRRPARRGRPSAAGRRTPIAARRGAVEPLRVVHQHHERPRPRPRRRSAPASPRRPRTGRSLPPPPIARAADSARACGAGIRSSAAEGRAQQLEQAGERDRRPPTRRRAPAAPHPLGALGGVVEQPRLADAGLAATSSRAPLVPVRALASSSSSAEARCRGRSACGEYAARAAVV